MFYILNATGSLPATLAGLEFRAAGRRIPRPCTSATAHRGRESLRHVVRLQREHRVDHLRFVFVRRRNNVALTIPGVGAYLSGNPTVAHTWCPSGTSAITPAIVSIRRVIGAGTD